MANYRVCRCIQSAADATLSVKDQSLAVAIIRNPDNVTELKSSKRRNHALFMEGYSQFGELARAFCSYGKRRAARLQLRSKIIARGRLEFARFFRVKPVTRAL